MWQWFTNYSVWVFIAAGLVLTSFFFLKERLQKTFIKRIPEIQQNRIRRGANIAFWTIEGIALAIIALAFVAITLSRTGIHALITPQTIQKWLLEHGTSILVILVVGIGLWYALKNFLPPLLRRAMTQPVRGENREGRKRRGS